MACNSGRWSRDHSCRKLKNEETCTVIRHISVPSLDKDSESVACGIKGPYFSGRGR